LFCSFYFFFESFDLIIPKRTPIIIPSNPYIITLKGSPKKTAQTPLELRSEKFRKSNSEIKHPGERNGVVKLLIGTLKKIIIQKRAPTKIPTTIGKKTSYFDFSPICFFILIFLFLKKSFLHMWAQIIT